MILSPSRRICSILAACLSSSVIILSLPPSICPNIGEYLVEPVFYLIRENISRGRVENSHSDYRYRRYCRKRYPIIPYLREKYGKNKYDAEHNRSVPDGGIAGNQVDERQRGEYDMQDFRGQRFRGYKQR
jgi:hypothetical protein